MEKTLTIAEIESQFDSEWVLIENPQTNASLQVTAGKVLWHSRDRDEVYQKAIELRPAHFAVLFTGPNSLPSGTAIVL
jgi:hypothetical protein